MAGDWGYVAGRVELEVLRVVGLLLWLLWVVLSHGGRRDSRQGQGGNAQFLKESRMYGTHLKRLQLSQTVTGLKHVQDVSKRGTFDSSRAERSWHRMGNGLVSGSQMIGETRINMNPVI